MHACPSCRAAATGSGPVLPVVLLLAVTTVMPVGAGVNSMITIVSTQRVCHTSKRLAAAAAAAVGLLSITTGFPCTP